MIGRVGCNALTALLLACNQSAGGGPTPHERLLRSYGVEAGDPQEEIGEITDLRVTPGGVIFVLDRPEHRVLIIDSTGGYLGTLGGSGSGPGEFSIPVAMVFDPSSSTLLVLDQALARISLFSWDGMNAHYSGSIPVTPWAVDLCVMNGELYLYSPSDQPSAAIQVVESSGQVRRSFASPFGLDGGLGMQMAKRGAELLCLPEENSMVLASHADGEIRSYSAEGELLWQTVISNSNTVQVQLTPGGGFRVDHEKTPEPWDLLDNVFVADSTTVGVQFVRNRTVPRGDPYIPPRFTVYLDLKTGIERSRSENSKQIVTIRGAEVYVVQNDPFPQLQVWQGIDQRF